MSDPGRLQPVPGDSGAYQWADSNVNLARYNKILLERIQVQLTSDADYKAVDPTQLKMLVDYAHQAIVKALGNAYRLSPNPGRDVLRVRISLSIWCPQTGNERGCAGGALCHNSRSGLGAASGGPMGSTPYLGRTGIAVQFIDTETSRVIAEYADTRVGRKYVVDTSQGIDSAVHDWRFRSR
ncbi:MAG: DUF3313 family protein [Candidatus Competibacteraceae bacterium]|nr:DUF3313 family protein [Candidatus Competibacteraceae bacterium]